MELSDLSVITYFLHVPKEETTSDGFSFVMDKKFISLIYLKENKESPKADFAWETLTKTLQVKGKNSKKSAIMIDSGSDAILNGKAIKLPEPMFPSISGSRINSKYTERVKVKVTIDENGNVISAKAVSGSPNFHPAAIQAAKEAKFTPTYLCGELTKVSGIIVYDFVYN